MLEEMLLERIKIYRKRARLSQSDMASYLGYKGKSGYSNLENGKVKMTEMTSRVYNPDFKAPTLTAVTGGHQEKKVYIEGKVRKLTPLEYERLQTVPDRYTDSASNSQRYKMLGNGWTVDVIAYIFKQISAKDKLIHNDTYINENIPYKKAE